MNRRLKKSVLRVHWIAGMLAAVWVSSAGIAHAQAPAPAPPPAQAPAEPPKTWTGSAGAGLSLTSGNSDTLSFNVAFDITRDPKTRNVIKFNALYLRSEQDDTLTADRIAVGFRDEYTLTSRVFLFGQIDYLRDTFKLIDYLVAPTGGVGFKVINTEQTKLTVDGGAGAVWEKNPGIDVSTSGALTAGEKLTHQITATTTLKQGITGLWKTVDLSDPLYTFTIGLGMKITEQIQLSIDVLDTYKNLTPTPETESNDVAVVTAITAKF